MAGGANRLDKLMVIWAIWLLLSSAFHKNPSAAFVYRLGLAYNACGVYFLIRVFCQSMEDIVELCHLTALLLTPVAIEMLFEKMTFHNLFSVLGGVAVSPVMRKGRIRAQGPFAHAILAGTIGAASMPLTISIWHTHRRAAFVGVMACLLMVFTCASSGPIISLLVGIGALYMWHWRNNMRLIRWVMVLGYIVLALVMKAPAYYFMSHIDFTGGSTGWYRARLIQSAFEHLNEWWFAGVDYTRHWMPTGTYYDTGQADIVNHYIRMGVIGGLPLMLLLIAILAEGFSLVGCILRQRTDLGTESQFMLWALGASLFTHAVSFFDVSYFDQSFVSLYTTLAAIGSARFRNDRAPL